MAKPYEQSPDDPDGEGATLYICYVGTSAAQLSALFSASMVCAEPKARSIMSPRPGFRHADCRKTIARDYLVRPSHRPCISSFGLNEQPFSIAVNPRYLFMSARHRDALAHLLYGVGSGGGFILLTGEVGTGKTT
ncbi:MAG: hypothetical protein CM15mP84_05990 [Cellvibrionales bacterium]|nr:MAG: hypothetical protein CM15mP84_05990 [Cellvibrionales bacterium]